MNNIIVIDIETDGLDPTLIHVLSAHFVDADQTISFTEYKDMKDLLKRLKDRGNVIVGHNFIRYDKPALENILKIKVDVPIIDSLALSWYLFPDRNRHGLEQWGDDLGVKKPEIKDWKNLNKADYVHRCESDVKINTLLWKKQRKKLLDLYGGVEEADKFIKYLSFKMDCAAEQERSKWKLNVQVAEEGVNKLIKEKEEKVEQLQRVMPKVPTIAKRNRPAKPYRKDGSLSATGERWFGLLRERSLPEDFIGVVEVITGYKDPKPTSSKQIKDWLYSLGWKPETYKYVRNKETGDIKQIPQVNLDKGEGICPSIKKLYHKDPNVEVLDGLSILTHRISILNGLLKEVDTDGYVKAEIQGLTNTLRFKHAVCVNLPKVSTPHGSLIRGVLTAPEGYELCGSDMCSLEQTTKLHYMWDYDKPYVREMMKPDFDAHLDLAVIAGKITREQAQAHVNGEENHSDIRSQYKVVNYGAVYGAGPPTIARSAGVTLAEGKELFETYWKRNWSVKAIPKKIKTKKISDGSMWLLNPVSKFWYSLRAEKDIFSTLNQGTGVYCFDTWVAFVRSKRPQLTAQFHDEIVTCIKEGHREENTKLLKWAIAKTNKKVGLNVKLDVDIQYGKTYAEVH